MSNIFTLKAVQISRQSWAVILRHDETSFIHQINLRDAKAREDYINRIKIKFLHIPRDELSVQLNKLAVELSLPEIPIKPIPIANIPGKSLDLPAPEPWPEPVNSADIINEISQTMSQFVALPNGAADAIALWTAHTHCFQAFSHTPRLHITSPQKQCGKTTLLNILGCLVPKSLRVENVSLEALFCVIDKWCPVILIDQDDSIFFNNDDLCSVLIAGHEHGRRMIRDGGDENELRAFDVFTPAVISSISAIPGTLQDRSIPVRLFRAKPGELRQRFDSMQTEHEENLRRKLSRFAADNFQRIKDCAPTLPPGAYNRLADNWRPLFAIAEIAGGDWPDRARAAFTALADQRDQDAQDIGVMLLTDIRRIFTEQRIERILSTRLVHTLNAMADRPWSELHNGQPINQAWLAIKLRAFDILPRPMRVKENIVRGYFLTAFSEAFERYLPPVEKSKRYSATTPENIDVSSTIKGATSTNHVTDQKVRNTL